MNKKVTRPLRDQDYTSKRGVYYWFAPEWIRGTSGSNTSFGKIKAIKEKDGEVNLYMQSKDGHVTYIQGSIQQEFRKWHEDRSIDYILLGENPDDILEE
jgi:hypothetical protein